MFSSSSRRHPIRGFVTALVLLLGAETAVPAVAGCPVAPAARLEAVAADRLPKCPVGTEACVDRVVREMTRRFDALAETCDHDAVFALVYLRTTEVFRETIEDPEFFEDTEYVIREDVLFANLYFEAFDDWHAGRVGEVPEAWRIAFRAAEGRAVSGGGDILLGMNAHINRDLPYVLAELGLVDEQGRSRKGDHDRVNDFLRRVMRPVLEEASRRFDPTIDDANLKGTTLDDEALFTMVVGWREQAWRHAERLVAAGTPEERAAVEAAIETFAATEARSIRATTAYLPPLTTTAARDAYCAEHWDDAYDPDASEEDGSLLLSLAYPNPFNPQTTFTVQVEERRAVRVEVFDVLGRRVALLHDGDLAPGTPHRFTFDASRLPGGTYLVRAADEVRRVVLVK